MYYYHIYRRRLQNALREFENKSDKINFLEANLNLTNQDIYCIEKKIAELFFIDRKKKSNCRRFEKQLNSYKEYLNVKLNYSNWSVVLKPLESIIRWSLLIRYLNRLKGEKLSYRVLIEGELYKVKKEIEPEGSQYLLFETLDTIRESEDETIFKPGNQTEITKVEVNLKFNFNDYMNGYTHLLSIVEPLSTKDKITALSEMKEDIERLLKATEHIDNNLLNNYSNSYKVFLLSSPETIAIIEFERRRLAKKKNPVTVRELNDAIKNRTIKNYAIINNIEEQLKITEAKRSLKKKTKPEEKKEKIIWLGTETQVMDLFYLLAKDGYLVNYDENFILTHFRVLNTDGTYTTSDDKNTGRAMTWLKTDNEFVQLITELGDNNLIPTGKKWKNVEKHFVNREQEPFVNLTQKKWILLNECRANPRISKIVKNVTEIVTK